MSSTVAEKVAAVADEVRQAEAEAAALEDAREVLAECEAGQRLGEKPSIPLKDARAAVASAERAAVALDGLHVRLEAAVSAWRAAEAARLQAALDEHYQARKDAQARVKAAEAEVQAAQDAARQVPAPGARPSSIERLSIEDVVRRCG
jgi:hypothetical protein